MGLTREARVQALVACRFTERQARFLELVLRHGGMCVPRQYAAFAAVPNGGERCNEFFQRLVWHGRAVRCQCVHNRAHLYHIHHRRLYQAIGEADSPWRRPVPVRQAVRRVMLLDAVLTTPDLEWLTSPAETAAFVARVIQPDAGSSPLESAGRPPGSTPARRRTGVMSQFPIGIDAEGRAVLVYLAQHAGIDEFRTWLQDHATLLERVSAWTLRLVFPRPLDHSYPMYQQVIRDEWETPLQPASIRDLQAYFRRRATRPSHWGDPRIDAILDGLSQFESPRFHAVYPRWVKHGDDLLESLASTRLADALTSGSGRVECLVLPYVYRHLAPVVDASTSVEKGDEGEDETPTRPQPPRSTPAFDGLSVQP